MSGLLPKDCNTIDDALDKAYRCWELRLMQASFWPYLGGNEAAVRGGKVLKHQIWRDGKRRTHQDK